MKVQSSVRSILFVSALFISSIGSAQDFARETGLTIGNGLEAVQLRGTVRITCFDPKGGIESATYNCKRDTLFPAEYSRFQTSSGVDADQVFLSARHEDGSTRDKSDNFVGQYGRSQGHFNLWVRTLFQRPLLEVGRNEITYRLAKNNVQVQSGKFTVMVKTGGALTCQRGDIQSHDVNDCRQPAYACDRYFFEFDYCR